MGRRHKHIPILLVTLTFLTVTQAQYYDIIQGLQQLFKPYPQQENLYSPFNDVRNTGTHRQPSRHESKKKQDSHTKSPPIHQYDYIFSTTPKPNRKSTKQNSSQGNSKPQSNRNFNTDLIFSDYFTSAFEVTTKKNRVTPIHRVKTTTAKPINNVDRVTTENVFNSMSFVNRGSNSKPVVESGLNNNHRNVYVVNDYETPANLQEYNPNTRRPESGGNGSKNFNRVPSNTRNPTVHNININNLSRPTNTRNPDVNAISNPHRVNHNNLGSSTAGFVNTDHNIGNTFNRGNTQRVTTNTFNSDRGILNTDYDGSYPGNPLINRPGVKPAPVDVNQPPITNKPVTDRNNFLPFERPDDFGSSEKPIDSPEIIIGPDEDDMSEAQKRRYIDMTEKMCDRYKALNVKEVVALPLLPSPDPVELNVSSCVPITAPLVIGGRIATINEFPHMALVGWRKIRTPGYSWKCGGSLISDRYILSAGHCTYQDKDYDVERWVDPRSDYQTSKGINGPPQAVQLGSSYLDDPGALVIKISAVIRHPKYKQRRSYYDIALIKMVDKVKFSEVIRPACLGVPPPVGENIIATGWGRTEFGGDHSVELRSVSLPVWNMAECREVWGTSLKLPNGPTADSHVCAGEKKGGKDTCQGDSGGPAQIQDGCVWRVVAVTSFGRSCGAPNTPALYAITKRAFIAAQIFEDEKEQPFGSRDQVTQPSFSDRQQPSYSDRQQPSYSDRQQPSFSDRQQPSFSDRQQPSFSDRHQPVFSDRQQPSFFNRRQPVYSDGQQPYYSDRQQPNYFESRQPSFSDRQQPSFSDSQYGFSNTRQPTYFVNNFRRE